MKFKKTKWGSRIIKDQMDLIRKLSELDVRLDLFGDMGDKDDVWLAELNYYVKDYPKDDEFKGQKVFVHSIDCENEEAIIFGLQGVLDVLYVMKYHEPIPRTWYFPNRIPIKPVTGKQLEKLLKGSKKLR